MNEQFYELPQEKQMRITNAAMEVFAKNDYKHAVTDEIAQRAGISKGLLFYYFHNKKGLYLFVWDTCAKLIMGQITNGRFGEITDFFELIEYAAEEKAKLLRQTPYLMEFVTRCFYADGGQLPEEMTAAMKDFPAVMSKTYFENVDFGKFREGISPVEIYQMLTWMTDGFIHDRQRAGRSVDLEEVMDLFYVWERRLKKIAYRAEFLTDEERR